MQCEQKQYSIAKLVEAWKSSSLRINEEYQRGARWTQTQKQALIDSIFRAYPIPPLFLHQIVDEGLDGNRSTRFEIVDGQQRIRALADYLADKFPLLQPTDRKLRLPNSLRSLPAPWAGKRYSDLDASQQEYLANQEITVLVITTITNPDEVRDLFIRLQSGTALTRQEIRDAWPGNMGPYIERLAGKLEKQPSIRLFSIMDKRGMRREDARDRREPDRQACAQLMTLFLAREHDPCAGQSVGANDLDALYHEHTDFDVKSESAQRFETLLKHTSAVFSKAQEIAASRTRTNRKKFKKLDVMATFLFFQDLMRYHQSLVIQDSDYNAIAEHVLSHEEIERIGKSTSGRAIMHFYAQWLDQAPDIAGIPRDPKRQFDDSQKRAIYQRAEGRCAICGDEVKDVHAEYDHHPVPWALGGQTDISNGRLVHRWCHPRGYFRDNED